MLAHGRIAPLRSHDRPVVHPFDDDDFISGNGPRRWRFWKTCRMWMP
jgi:hypothetical protein